MKFPSLASLADAAYSTLFRFPFVIIAGLVGAIALIDETHSERWVLVPMLGISFLFALAVFGERRGWGDSRRLTAQAVGVVLLTIYFLSLPGSLTITDEVRYVLFLIAAHLLAAFAPFTARGDVEGFWRYNEILFLRALTAALFSLVLYAGLSLALVSIDRLFSITVEPKPYLDLAALLFGVFATWFFLAGVPRDFSALNGEAPYPRGLKIFTQYVLLPLVAIYLVILYLYAGKIVLTWQWPNGWVSAPVMGFAVAGILSALLLWPIREQEGNRWIRRFSGGFYWALLPLIVLLLLSLWRRVSDYGITENRYFMIVTALWLAGIALYFIISRRDNIKVIPITLCILALAGTFGPWSAFDVSANSQTARLRDILTREKIFVDGAIVPPRPGETIMGDVNDRVYSILYFLDERHALARLAPMIPASQLDTMSVAAVAARLGIAGRPVYGRDVVEYSAPNAGPFELGINNDGVADMVIPVSGYAVVHHLQMNGLTSRARRFVVDGLAYSLTYYDSTDILRVATDSAGSATFDLPALLDRAATSVQATTDSARAAGGTYPPSSSFVDRLTALPRQSLTADGVGELHARLMIISASVHRVEGKTKIDSYDCYLLIGGSR